MSEEKLLEALEFRETFPHIPRPLTAQGLQGENCPRLATNSMPSRTTLGPLAPLQGLHLSPTLLCQRRPCQEHAPGKALESMFPSDFWVARDTWPQVLLSGGECVFVRVLVRVRY